MKTKSQTRFCPICGAEIVPDPHKAGGSPQIYCCKQHQAKAAFARWYSQNRKRHIQNVLKRRKGIKNE